MPAISPADGFEPPLFDVSTGLDDGAMKRYEATGKIKGLGLCRVPSTFVVNEKESRETSPMTPSMGLRRLRTIMEWVVLSNKPLANRMTCMKFSKSLNNKLQFTHRLADLSSALGLNSEDASQGLDIRTIDTYRITGGRLGHKPTPEDSGRGT